MATEWLIHPAQSFLACILIYAHNACFTLTIPHLEMSRSWKCLLFLNVVWVGDNFWSSLNSLCVPTQPVHFCSESLVYTAFRLAKLTESVIHKETPEMCSDNVRVTLLSFCGTLHSDYATGILTSRTTKLWKFSTFFLRLKRGREDIWKHPFAPHSTCLLS